MVASSPTERAALRRRPGAAGIVVEVHREAAALRALVPDWEQLAADALEPNPFYEHWMLLPALEAYGASGLRCIAVWDNGTLAALFPMRLERGWQRAPLPVLRSWRHHNMMIFTPLVRATSAAACIAALLKSGLAPLVEFDWIPAGGPFFAALLEAGAEGRWPWMVVDAYARALLLRDRDPRGRFNSNMKNNLRRWQARLAEAGAVTPVGLAPGDDLAPWTREFMDLEASGWKGRAGTALACRAEDRRFADAVLAEAFRRGRLRITGLNLAGRPLARHVMFTAGDGAFSWKPAYDETYAKCSPGVLAEVDNVRQFMDSTGLRWMDSHTSRESTGYSRVWKDQRTVQRVAVGVRPAGGFALAGLQLLRALKRSLKK